jgi:hypothetical protein
MARSTTPREPRGNYVSEWFGHRIYPQVIYECEQPCGSDAREVPVSERSY